MTPEKALTHRKEKISPYDDRGVFIVGCHRSGTTLLRMILDSHPELCSGEETGFLKEMEDILIHRWPHLSQFGMGREEVLENVKTFFLSFHHHYCAMTGKTRWVDKTPNYVMHLDFINEMFPNCKVIHVIRDGRDVVASCKEMWGKKGFYQGVRDWLGAIEKARKASRWLGEERYYELRYEDLVVEPRRELKAITDFLGEEWNEALLEHTSHAHPTTKFKSYQRPLMPIDNTRVGLWQQRLNWYERLLATIGFKHTLRDLGYIKEKSAQPAVGLFFEKLVLRIANLYL